MRQPKQARASHGRQSRLSPEPGKRTAPPLLLSREEDYAYAQPSLTKKKLRRLEITAGAERYTQAASGIWAANDAVRQAERELAHQAELAYARTVRDWHAAQASREGASVTKGRASNTPSKGKVGVDI